MKRISWLVAGLSVMVLAASAQAQETSAPKNLLTQGAKSLSFAVPGGNNAYASGAAGFWYMLTEEINLGLNVGLGIDRHNAGLGTDTTYDFLLAPAMRYYLTTDGVVAPFIHGQTNIRLVDDGDFGLEWGLAGGVGAEWFPVRQFSIAGQVGLGVDVVRHNESEPRIGTFTSQLSAQLYWD